MWGGVDPKVKHLVRTCVRRGCLFRVYAYDVVIQNDSPLNATHAFLSKLIDMVWKDERKTQKDQLKIFIKGCRNTTTMIGTVLKLIVGTEFTQELQMVVLNIDEANIFVTEDILNNRGILKSINFCKPHSRNLGCLTEIFVSQNTS
jgi:hypothetical protein